MPADVVAPNLNQLVEQSMEAADPGGLTDTPDTGAETGTEQTETAEVETVGAETAEVETQTSLTEKVEKVETKVDAGKKPDETKVEGDELDQILSKYGIKGPQKGQKEGTFTYSRFRKVLGRELKGVADKFEANLKAKDTEIAPLKERTEQIAAVERIIAANPERYLTMLSEIHPQYKKYLGGAAAAPEKKTEPVADAAMPQPDAKFADGSTGYSPEQFQKYMDWRDQKTAARIREELKSDFDKRLTPFEQRQRAAEARAENLPRVQAKIKQMTERWGELFTNDVGDPSKPNPNSELMKFMRENPTATSDEAAIAVYLPMKEKQWQTKYDTQREAIHKELNGRPGAADRTGTTERSERAPGGPRTLEQIVAEKMREAEA